MEKAALNEIRPIMEKLNAREDMDNNVYICDIETFKLAYNLEKKRAKRSRKPAYLLYLKVIEEGLEEDDLEKISDRIIAILNNKLRSGDAASKYENNNFLIIVNNTEESKLKLLIERINYFFYNISNLKQQSTWIDIFKRTGLVWDYKKVKSEMNR